MNLVQSQSFIDRFGAAVVVSKGLGAKNIVFRIAYSVLVPSEMLLLLKIN